MIREVAAAKAELVAAQSALQAARDARHEGNEWSRMEAADRATAQLVAALAACVTAVEAVDRRLGQHFNGGRSDHPDLADANHPHSSPWGPVS